MANITAMLEMMAETQRMNAQTTKEMLDVIRNLAMRVQTLETKMAEKEARIRALEHGRVAYE